MQSRHNFLEYNIPMLKTIYYVAGKPCTPKRYWAVKHKIRVQECKWLVELPQVGMGDLKKSPSPSPCTPTHSPCMGLMSVAGVPWFTKLHMAQLLF